MSLCSRSVLRVDTGVITAFTIPSAMCGNFSETVMVRAILQWYEVRKQWWQV